MHDVLIVSVPWPTILAGLFFNNRAISELKSKIDESRRETRARFDRFDDRLIDIYRISD